MHCKQRQNCQACCCSYGFPLGQANATLTSILRWPLAIYVSWGTLCRISSKASVNRYITLESGHLPVNGEFISMQGSAYRCSRIFNVKKQLPIGIEFTPLEAAHSGAQTEVQEEDSKRHHPGRSFKQAKLQKKFGDERRQFRKCLLNIVK